MTLTDAQAQLTQMLTTAQGDSDAVYRAIRESRRDASQHASFTAECEMDYGLLKLALCDLTGNAAYRL